MKLSAKNSGAGVSAPPNGIEGKNSRREMLVSLPHRGQFIPNYTIIAEPSGHLLDPYLDVFRTCADVLVRASCFSSLRTH